MKTLHRSLFATAFAVIVSCALFAQPASAPASSDPSAALLKEDKAWADAIKGDLTKALSYWDDNAVFYRHGQPVLRGSKEISQTIKKNRQMPGFSLERIPKHAQVAGSGDMGYTTGKYIATVPGEGGSSSTFQGNYVCVWQKKSGAWKCITAMATRDSSD